MCFFFLFFFFFAFLLRPFLSFYYYFFFFWFSNPFTSIVENSITPPLSPLTRADVSSTGIPDCHRIFCYVHPHALKRSQNNQHVTMTMRILDEISLPTSKLASWDRRWHCRSAMAVWRWAPGKASGFASIETRPDRASWWSPCRDVSDPTPAWAPPAECGTRAVQLIQARIHLWPPLLANLLWLENYPRSIRLTPSFRLSLSLSSFSLSNLKTLVHHLDSLVSSYSRPTLLSPIDRLTRSLHCYFIS